MNLSIEGFSSVFSNFYLLITSNWIFMLPIAFLLVVLSKVSSKLIIFLLGFYSAYTMMIPYMMSFSQVKDFMSQFSQYNSIIFLAFAALIGILFYFIIKVAVGIVGFLLGGFIGYFLGNSLIVIFSEQLKQFENISYYIPWGCLIIIGIITAVLISKNFETITAIISIVSGSLLMSFYSLFLLEKHTGMKIGGNTLLKGLENVSKSEGLMLLFCFIIYCSLGFFIISRKKRLRRTS